MSAGEVVYEARVPFWQRAGEIAAAVALYPRTVWRHREMLANFYGRELRARFRGTVLGFAWPFAMPLFLFLVYYFVFAQLLGAKFGGVDPRLGEDDLKRQFTVYLFVGVIAWAGFAESVTRNVNVILENANLIKKIHFPSEILPLNVVLASLTIQALALGAFLLVAPLLGWNPIGWRLLALPALFVAQAIFSLGISLAVGSANVFVRDTAPLLGIVMTFWQFMTPVFWARQAIVGIENYDWVLRWNPMAHLLEGYRRVLVNPGNPINQEVDRASAFPTHEWPWEQCLHVSIAGIALFVLGYAMFLASKRRFADEL